MRDLSVKGAPAAEQFEPAIGVRVLCTDGRTGVVMDQSHGCCLVVIDTTNERHTERACELRPVKETK